MGFAGSQFHQGPGWDGPPLAAPIPPDMIIPSVFRPDITSWVQLSELVTVGAELPVILEWFDSTFNVMRTTVLQAGTDATDTTLGIQRPVDYDGATNAVVWYQKQ